MAEWTIKTLLAWTESYFGEHGIDSPRLTAEILLAKSLDLRRLDLYLQHDRPLEAGELADYKTLITRRRNREPVAYITGEKGFFDARFKVGPGVLIPRPDTEVLVETAMAALKGHEAANKRARVIELGVGSGAVIVSLAKACPDHDYFGCDLSSAAIETARSNAQAIAQSPVRLFQGSWLSAVAQDTGFDLILSNPPYIPRADIETLAPEIREHEPRMALDGGADGLTAIHVILDQASVCLSAKGQVMLEMGYDQKPLLAEVAKELAWVQDCQFVRDLAGHYRLAVFKK